MIAMLPAPQEKPQGWKNSEHQIFQQVTDSVRTGNFVLHGIEIGCWKGASTLQILQAMNETNQNDENTLLCIDTWLGAAEFYTNPTPERDLQKLLGYPQVYYQFLSNIYHAGYLSNIRPLPLPSNIAYKTITNIPNHDVGFDFVYIDGSHEYEDVLSDIKNYWPLLRQGGVMFGDDYTNSAFPGVKKAVDEIFADGGQLEIVDNWFWKITKYE
jgi:predicted O-methyltransferase YrrM